MSLPTESIRRGTERAQAVNAAGERDAAWRPRILSGLDAIERIGAARYRRARDLPRLLPDFALFQASDDARSIDIIGELRRAVLRERSLGASGHRAYNLVRHMALVQALKAEEAIAGTKTPSRS